MQANQESNMNVISTKIMRKLKLKLKSLIEIDFQELFMQTIDYQKIVLHH